MGCSTTVTADKIVSVAGETTPVTYLIGNKELGGNILGSSDLTKSLAGDTIVFFTQPTDKIVSLLGSTTLSLIGTKSESTLFGEHNINITLLGNAPCSYFNIHCDTTYYFADDGNVTCDRN